MILLSEIHERLTNEIKGCGMTQCEIADKLGIKQSTVAQYVSGRAMPALDTFANLCTVLDVDPADILGTDNLNKNA